MLIGLARRIITSWRMRHRREAWGRRDV